MNLKKLAEAYRLACAAELYGDVEWRRTAEALRARADRLLAEAKAEATRSDCDGCRSERP